MIRKKATIKARIRNCYENIQFLLKKYDKVLMPVFLLLGFFIDTLTLNRVDQIFDNIVLIVYLLLACVSIYFFHKKTDSKLKIFAPYLMQYAFGGLFSGLVIFYFMSSNFWISLPFLLILLILFIGNDFLHRKYQKLIFQISILYVGIFSYSILIVPIILRMIGHITFIIGSILSLFVIFLIIWIFKKKFKLTKNYLVKVKMFIWSIFIIFNFFYLTNIIPPIPLSMKQGFVSYNVDKVKQDYIALVDENPWYVFWNNYNNKVYLNDNEPVFVFSSIFAPNNFESTIIHEWSYFSTEKNRWIITDKIPIEIKGGLDRGYRGYSFKSNLSPGDWRVNIKNVTNQTIGRIMFKNIQNKEKPTLTEITI